MVPNYVRLDIIQKELECSQEDLNTDEFIKQRLEEILEYLQIKVNDKCIWYK